MTATGGKLAAAARGNPTADHHNSFDLVRLFAASQVMLGHVLFYMPGCESVLGLKALSPFPGVPIFFFISGFLIGGSWRRNPDAVSYISSRVLRIFPALWLSVAATFVLLLLLYPPIYNHLPTAGLWLLMQVSFLQSWNPGFVRDYATGLANPALWTIPVELSFYLILPILYVLGRKLNRRTAVVVAAALLSFGIFCFVFNVLPNDTDVQFSLRKILTLSPLSCVTWLWMFLMGAICDLHFGRVRTWVTGRFWWFAAGAALVALASFHFDWPPILHLPGNEVGILNAVATNLACLSFAYSYPDLANRLLRKMDLSYGIYLFHMPVLNALIVIGITGPVGGILTVIATPLFAALSYRFLEWPALLRKKRLASWLVGRRPFLYLLGEPQVSVDKRPER